MKLSIVIPCFNCEKNIGRLLDVLFKQTTDKLEVILINDGSQDRTGSIISAFIEQHKLYNFKLYEISNSGAAKARQTGLDKSSGKYVFFCDSDDLISEDFVTAILQRAESNPDIIYFSSEIVSSNNASEKISDKVRFNENVDFDNPDEFLRFQLSRGAWTAAVWTYAFRRDLVQKSNAYFTPRSVHEDHLFSLRLLGSAKKITALKQTLYLQKYTLGSLTNSKKNTVYLAERYRAFIEARDDMRDYFTDATIQLYENWSITSFIYLCKSNPGIVLSGLLYKNTYSAAWNSKSIFCRLVKNKKLKISATIKHKVIK